MGAPDVRKCKSEVVLELHEVCIDVCDSYVPTGNIPSRGDIGNTPGAKSNRSMIASQDRFDVGDWIGHLGQVNYPYLAARIMYDSEVSGRPTATEAVESIGGQGRSPFGTGGWSCTRFQEGPPFLG